MSEDGGIFRSLARVDWLVLLVVALYALALGAPPALYGGIAAYGAFVAAMRWRGFPLRSAPARLALGAAVMVAFITLVAALTGGPASPMVHLYLLPVVVAAMTMKGTQKGALGPVKATNKPFTAHLVNVA